MQQCGMFESKEADLKFTDKSTKLKYKKQGTDSEIRTLNKF